MKRRIFLFILMLAVLTGCPFKKQDKYISQFQYLTANVKEIRYISEEEAITRKDVAYLFSVYFPVTVKSDMTEVPFDIRMYPYPSLIYSAVKRGMVSIYPDSTFKPDEVVSRHQLAIYLAKYVLTVDPFFNANFREIEIADVDYGFFAYRPVAMIIGAGVMETRNDSFYPEAVVSGYDAIRFFHRIREFYR